MEIAFLSDVIHIIIKLVGALLATLKPGPAIDGLPEYAIDIPTYTEIQT